MTTKLPQRFIQQTKQILAEEFDDFLESYSLPVYQGIRINTTKVKMEYWNKITPFENLQQIPWCLEGFYYDEQTPSKHPYYYAGLYYIQEPSAMSPASYLPIEKGDKVLDLCAAPGGKTTQIGAKLDNTGVLVSNDISATRAKALVKNIELFGFKNAIVTSEAPEKLANFWKGYFDKILVDAPCSGEGMFKKDSAAIKSWENYEENHFFDTQLSLLSNADKMLKVGGYILYSTCTFNRAENENIIDAFLAKNQNFEVAPLKPINKIKEVNGALRLWPHCVKGEGHFLCLLYKKYGDDFTPNLLYPKNKIKDFKLLADFISSNTYISLDEYVFLNNDNFYLVNSNMPNHNKLRTLRTGLLLGSVQNNRFKPSHALALAYPSQIFKNIINFKHTDINVIKYLKGETLDGDYKKGDYIVCVDSFPLGWIKSNNGTLKNQYPVSWRKLN
ncbi:RNA methyltransferase [Candidatus Epulonipiscium fishelsonii]|uniref:RNA methyltransferase n=1 Tax=Candidatus Epulonipiscium fishelsonii TaxID=77094 RepID=A0ACC8XE10_9FIRM|nr:RNA methyltransferase [Epulopiscium sp. SCG-B11WGA-EpuloA1]ONI43815.1 RNA methyltransferase [Epulopiscium sp. SCG-B05WGA-EpuloA1]